MAGNSLGLLPKEARVLIGQELDVWGSRSVLPFALPRYTFAYSCPTDLIPILPPLVLPTYTRRWPELSQATLLTPTRARGSRSTTTSSLDSPASSAPRRKRRR